MGLSVVILAAGRGKRMRSRLPKVLHTLAGRPLVAHVIEAANALSGAELHLVHGFGGDALRAALPEARVRWVHQPEQLGTGHAVARALPDIPDEDTVLVVSGDVPLITPQTLDVLAAAGSDSLALLTHETGDPAGYGRIIRAADGTVERIVEERDATPAERAVGEINTGTLAAPAHRLRGWLSRLRADNSQGEYYLTDVVALAVAEGFPVTTAAPGAALEVAGVNDRAQLAALERAYQAREAQRLMAAGVTVVDPARLDVRGHVETGQDVVIDVNVILEGRVRLGDGVRIGPHCVLKDVELAGDAEVLAHSVIEGAVVGPHASIGPFARVRPGCRLDAHARVGNFVEIKNSHVGEASKINHLSYVGDTTVGRRVNIGAGTITCNYDGARKHRTVIGDDAFIGSSTQLVAPVEVGAGATIGAGSTITREAPAGELTLSRTSQKTIRGWRRPDERD